jgi:hypothetical protein
MFVINLWGGPCAGKSTTAAVVFADLKNHGIQAELVGEYAKELIWQGKRWMLGPNGDQKIVFKGQLARLLNLYHSECEVAIADSPLLQNLAYAKGRDCYEEIKAEALAYENLWTHWHVWIDRTEHYSTFGRVHTLDQAIQKDIEIKAQIEELGMRFDVYARGDEEGQRRLAQHLREDIEGELQYQAIYKPHDTIPDSVRSNVCR